MPTETGFELLLRPTDPGFARPMSAALVAARAEVSEAVDALRTIDDADLTRPWAWKGGGEEEIRYGFYRIGERFELAEIEAGAALRSNPAERGRAGDLIAPATAARWDLHGLLAPSRSLCGISETDVKPHEKCAPVLRRPCTSAVSSISFSSGNTFLEKPTTSSTSPSSHLSR